MYYSELTLGFGVAATLYALAITLTVFNLHIGFTKRYLTLVAAIFEYGQQRIEAKKQASRDHISTDDQDIDYQLPNQSLSSSSLSSLEDLLSSSYYSPKQTQNNKKCITFDIFDDYQDEDEDDDEDEDEDEDYECKNHINNKDTHINSCNKEYPKQTDKRFKLKYACKFVSQAINVIIDDQVTKRFYSPELSSWNLLTRTNSRHYQFKSLRIGLIWLLGCVIRYVILMPIRLSFALLGLATLFLSASIIGALPEPAKSLAFRCMSLASFRMLSKAITATIKFHNQQYRPQKGDLVVANHTSPIDVLMLACDNCYSLVGQKHTGFLGILEKMLSRVARHVWFDRSEFKDRQLVVKRIKEHVQGSSTNCINQNNILTQTTQTHTHAYNTKQQQNQDNSYRESYSSRNLPILIFPEGTCINNSAIMMFKKGSFEASDRICPIAMKYDLRFGDPFWNSSQQGYFQYLLMMMSSWAIKCDIWYLPPMTRRSYESPEEFANRVKHAIAQQCGLIEVDWDGQLKRESVKAEWKYKQQEQFAKSLLT